MKLSSVFASIVLVTTSLSLTVKIVEAIQQQQDDDDEDGDIRPHNHQRAGKMNACLQNCANCVQFWEHGLYNGRRCAKRCLHRRGRVVVDPDCNDPKMFNYSPRIISDLLIEMRENQADQPVRSHHDDDDDDNYDDDEEWRITSQEGGVRSRSTRSGGDETGRRAKQRRIPPDINVVEHHRRNRQRVSKRSTTPQLLPSYEPYVVRRSYEQNSHTRQFRIRPSERPRS